MFKTENFPWIVLFAVVLVAILAATFGWVSNVATFRTNELEDIVTPLFGLFVAALFMERVQEVFVKIWRQSGRLDIEEEVQRTKNVLAKDGNDENAAALQSAEWKLEHYKNVTKNFAFALGLLIGFFFSLVGVRTLSEIMDYENLVGFQAWLLECVDLVVTAGVIAGGSEAIHKLISVFTDGFDATRKMIKKSAAG